MPATQLQIASAAGEAEEPPASGVATVQQSTGRDAATVGSSKNSSGMQNDSRAAAATPPIRAELLEAFGSSGKAQLAASPGAGSTTRVGQQQGTPGQHSAAAGLGGCPSTEQEAEWPAAGVTPGAAALGGGSPGQASQAGACIRPDLLEAFGSSSKQPAAAATPEDAPVTLAPHHLPSTCKLSVVSRFRDSPVSSVVTAESAEQADSGAQPADAVADSDGGAAGTESDAAQRTPVSIHSSWASVATTVPATQLHGAHAAQDTPLSQALPGLVPIFLVRATSPAAAQPAVQHLSAREAAGQEAAAFGLAAEEQAAGVNVSTTARVEVFLDRLFAGVAANLAATGDVPPADAAAAAAADTGSAAAEAEPEAAAQRSLKRLASKVRHAGSL